MNQNTQMQAREIMDDVLSTEKMLTGNYNTFANECATPAIREEFMSILNEEHQMQMEIFDEMSKRGWYSPEAAEQQKISQAKQKFQSMGGQQ